MVLRPGRPACGDWHRVGGVVAVGAGQLLQSFLYGVSSVDPIAYLAAGGVLLLVATLANLVPAITAARIDPMRALRRD